MSIILKKCRFSFLTNKKRRRTLTQAFLLFLLFLKILNSYLKNCVNIVIILMLAKSINSEPTIGITKNAIFE